MLNLVNIFLSCECKEGFESWREHIKFKFHPRNHFTTVHKTLTATKHPHEPPTWKTCKHPPWIQTPHALASPIRNASPWVVTPAHPRTTRKFCIRFNSHGDSMRCSKTLTRTDTPLPFLGFPMRSPSRFTSKKPLSIKWCLATSTKPNTGPSKDNSMSGASRE